MEKATMKKKLSPAILIVSKLLIPVLFFPPHTVPAQQSSAALTLKDAFVLVKKNNLNLKQFKTAMRQAQLETGMQKTGYLPTVATAASYNYISELAKLEVPLSLPGISIPPIEAGVKNQYDFAILVKQPLFTGFRTKNLIRSAEAKEMANIGEKEILLNKLYLQTGRLFYSIQLNRYQRKALQQSVRRADFQLEKARNLLQAQQLTRFDTLQVANRKLILQTQILRLQHVEEILLSKLRFLLNTDTPTEIQLIRLQQVNLTLEDLSTYLRIARENRPELRKLLALKDARSFSAKAVRSIQFPQIFASATYHYARPGVNFFKDEWMNYFTAGVNLQWEIWNWRRTKRQTEQVKLGIRQIELQNQQMMKNIEQEIEEACKYLIATKEQIVLQKKIVAQEKERYCMVSQKFEQGMATSLDISDAEKKLTEAELLLQKDYVEWRRYQLQLDYATGLIGKK